MATCPSGHDSADDEFCDVCGREIDGPAPEVSAAPAASAASAATAHVPAPDLPPVGAACAACDAPLAGRFCEVCGHDSLAAPPPREVRPPADAPAEPAAPGPAPAEPTSPGPVPAGGPPAPAAAAVAWTATVSADRAYFDTVMSADGPDAGGITFPPFCPDRHFPLRGKQISIGRHSRSRGIDPDIDLTGPPEDPGVSHLHALLIAAEDGTWSIVDLDSSNGVTVNDDPRPLRPNTPHPLAEGDRVYLGAWTRITLRTT